MKKLFAIIISAAMIISLAACSEQSGSSSDQSSKESTVEETTQASEKNTGVKVIDDHAVAGMEFTPPKSYSNANRNVVESLSGSVIEKDMIYILNDESVLKVIVMAGTKLDDLINTDDYKDKVEQDGVTFHTTKAERYASAYTEKDGCSYIINFTGSSDTPSYEEYDALLKSVHFTGETETAMNDFDMYDIVFKNDSSDSMLGYTIAVQEDPKGEIMTKSVTSNYGDDTSGLEYSIRVKIFRNRTIDDVLSEVYTKSSVPETEKKTVNGTEYTTAIPKADSGETKSHAYYTQHGSDVYAVYNDGGGVYEITRTDESWAAFEEFLDSISFK